MKKYAGISSRETPHNVLAVMSKTAILLANDGYGLRTGACVGADQAFANGAASVMGFITLLLPWGSYEKEWVKYISSSGTDLHVIPFSPSHHITAAKSVEQYHPTAAKLKSSVVALHARNYMILLDEEEPVEFVVCWTPNGAVTGGTGQAIRIAEDKGIKVYNLGNPKTLDAFLMQITIRGL